MQKTTDVAIKNNGSTALVVLDENKIKQELQLATPDSISKVPVDQALEEQADHYVAMLLSGSYDPQDKRMAIDGMGLKTQQECAHRSKMLQQPINNLAKTGEDGGPVANALVDLKMQIEELDPVNFDFSVDGFTRLVGKIPFIGSPLKRYFTRYESAQTVIDAIIKSLELGGNQLKRDNITLANDQKTLRNSTIKLEKAIQLGQLLDQKLQYKLDREILPEDEQSAFVAEELLFPLRQRTLDLQQQLAVSQQGILAIEVIIRNNRELIRGVDRALNVTINALQVAVAVALALANQRIVLRKIDAINKTTSDLIAHTAERLKTQGVAIHKQASQTMLDMQSLEKAFADIKTAMDDIAKFRQEALPQMANSILRLNQLTDEASKAIEKMERGTAAQASFTIDVT